MLSGSRFLVACFLRQSKPWTTPSRAYSPKPRRKASGKEVIDEKLLPVLAVLGKPNVGKSALFNRLLQRAEALVKNTPEDHVTRDFREGTGSLGDLRFKLVDTSGLEPFKERESIQGRAADITVSVVKASDAAILMVDARAGISHADRDLARWLRENVQTPLILAVNKAEHSRARGSAVQDTLSEAAGLGLGDPVAISAATGEGMADLYQAVQPILDPCIQRRKLELEKRTAASSEASGDRIRMAVIGLPNAGKSTLMNQLLGRVRSITGPEPGLTRDAVTDSFSFEGHPIDIVDTAGWLNRGRLKGETLGGHLAEGAQTQTLRAFNAAHVVVLVVDATSTGVQEQGMKRRELSLAADVIREGRALIIVVNKLDALPPSARLQVEAKVDSQLQRQLPEVRGAPCLGVSALTGAGVEELLPAVAKAFEVWNQRVPTARLNKWLVRTAEGRASESIANDVLRVRYVTQVKSRPPSFVAFVSGGDKFPPASLRFLGKSLRETFGFEGVPLRIDVRMRKRLRHTSKTALPRRTPPPKVPAQTSAQPRKAAPSKGRVRNAAVVSKGRPAENRRMYAKKPSGTKGRGKAVRAAKDGRQPAQKIAA